MSWELLEVSDSAFLFLQCYPRGWAPGQCLWQSGGKSEGEEKEGKKRKKREDREEGREEEKVGGEGRNEE